MCLARAAGVAAPVIAGVLKSFRGVEHRCEKVAVVNGVQYINDSKAPTQTLRLSHRSFYRPLSLLPAEGQGTDFDTLLPAIRNAAAVWS